MNRKGQEENPSVSTYLVLIGIIFAVLIMFAFANLMAKAFRSSDSTFESASEYAAKLSAFPSSNPLTSIVKLERGKLVLLFDNGTEDITMMTSDGPPGAAEVQDSELWLRDAERIKSTGRNPIAYIFDRPPACNGVACVVACKDLQIQKERDQIVEERTFRIFCEALQTRQVIGINKFIRKPYSHTIRDLTSSDLEDVLAESTSATHYATLGGVVLYAFNARMSYAGADLEERSDISLNDKGNTYSYFIERPLEPKVIRGTEDMMVYAQNLQGNAFICLDYPCADLEDIRYFEWKESLTACEAGDCTSLQSLIEANAAQGITLTAGEDVVTIKVGGNETVIKGKNSRFALYEAGSNSPQKHYNIQITKTADQAMVARGDETVHNKALLGITYTDAITFNYFIAQ